MLAATDGQSSCNQRLAETRTAASATLLPKCDNELQRTVLLQQASALKIIYNIYIYIYILLSAVSADLMVCKGCTAENALKWDTVECCSPTLSRLAKCQPEL